MPEIDAKDARVLLGILRSLHDWSTEDLAERAGLDDSTIRDYENGESTLSREAAEQLARAARVPELVLHRSLLPAVRYLREVVESDPGDVAGYRELEEAAERVAREAAELARAHYREVWTGMGLLERTKRGA